MSAGAIIVIAGPTASGKSALALRLARAIGGSIVNADSMQVYADLRLLTARPSPEDEGAAPHRLYGHVMGEEAYSVGRYLDELAKTFAAAAPGANVIVGGSGLYIKATLEGLSPVPPVPDDVRAHWRARSRRLSPSELHEVLAARDPDMAARLRPSDPQRIVRALEVVDATGKSLRAWQSGRSVPIVDGSRSLCLLVRSDRAELHGRIDARFEAMIAAGALDEVAALGERRLDPELPIMRALGVRPLLDHIAGRISRTQATARAKAETRQYAKRQETFFRHQLGDGFKPVAADEPVERLLGEWDRRS